MFVLIGILFLFFLLRAYYDLIPVTLLLNFFEWAISVRRFLESSFIQEGLHEASRLLFCVIRGFYTGLLSNLIVEYVYRR